MTRVWRVEDIDGRGPYSVLHGMGQAHNDDEHPDPYNDGFRRRWSDPFIGKDKPEWSPELSCGLRSREDVAEWFDGWGLKLAKAAFSVVVFDISDYDIYYGIKQLGFRRNKELIVKRFNAQEVIGCSGDGTTSTRSWNVNEESMQAKENRLRRDSSVSPSGETIPGTFSLDTTTSISREMLQMQLRYFPLSTGKVSDFEGALGKFPQINFTS